MANNEDNANKPSVTALRLPEFKYIFVNHLRMKVTPTEFTLFMGLVDEIDPGIPVGLESFGVIMTPNVIKSLAEVLTQTVKVFEEQHGVIKQPSVKPLDAKKMAAIIKDQRNKIEGKKD